MPRRNPRHEEGVSPTTSLVEVNTRGAECIVLPRERALKQSKGSKPFASKVKIYLEARYLASDKMEYKMDPVQVVADMRTTRNDKGNQIFSRNEWLNAAQIEGFFS